MCVKLLHVRKLLFCEFLGTSADFKLQVVLRVFVLRFAKLSDIHSE